MRVPEGTVSGALLSAAGGLAGDPAHAQPRANDFVHRVVFTVAHEVRHDKRGALFRSSQQHADSGCRNVQCVGRRALRHDLVGGSAGNGCGSDTAQLKPAAADIDFRGALAATVEVGNDNALRAHTFRDAHPPAASHLLPRGWSLRHDAAGRHIRAEEAVAGFKHQSVIGQYALGLRLRHADELGNVGLAAMNSEAHRGQRRGHEDDQQDQHAHHRSQEAPHQWASLSPAA